MRRRRLIMTSFAPEESNVQGMAIPVESVVVQYQAHPRKSTICTKQIPGCTSELTASSHDGIKPPIRSTKAGTEELPEHNATLTLRPPHECVSFEGAPERRLRIVHFLSSFEIGG